MGACDCVLAFHLAGENIGRLDTNLNTDGQDFRQPNKAFAIIISKL